MAAPLELQDLDPRAARFCLGIERFCRRELGLDFRGQTVLVAYSGGADSKALLFTLHFLRRRLGITLRAAILDHGLRPESGTEVDAARAVCARLGIPLHAAKRDVAGLARERRTGIEDAGRQARREFCRETLDASGGGWIATGHQRNDLAEDGLMRMIRGAGWPAMAGMAAVVPQERIVRPLLLTPRADIESFLAAIGESWFEDPSNRDPAQTRNRVRHDLLPLLLRENPNYLDGVADRWRMARADEALFDDLKRAIPVQPVADGLFLTWEALAAAGQAVRQRKYLDVAASLGRGQATAAALDALDAAWRQGTGGKVVQFSGGVRAVVRDGGILFMVPEATSEG